MVLVMSGEQSEAATRLVGVEYCKNFFFRLKKMKKVILVGTHTLIKCRIQKLVGSWRHEFTIREKKRQACLFEVPVIWGPF